MLSMAKSIYDSYRLRMVFGQWYIILYADNGATEIKRTGPFTWKDGLKQSETYRAKGLIDLDRLNDTSIR